MRSVRLLSLMALGCGSAPTPLGQPPAEPSVGPEATGSTAQAESPAESTEAMPTPAETAPLPARIHYDLGRNLSRAASFRGGGELIDLSSPQGAMATLGGWRTDLEPHTIGEIQARVSRRSTARLYFNQPQNENPSLVLRGMSFGRGAVRAYLNGEPIGSEVLEDWGTISFALPSEHLRPTDNELMLRVRGSTRLADFGNATIALQWIWVGQPEAPDAPPSFATNTSVPGLAIPAGWSLRFGVVSPEGARFRGVADGAGTLRAHFDDGREVELGSLSSGPLDIDLEAIEDEPVWLELAAAEDLSLLRPSVVTLQEPMARELPPPTNVLIFLVDTLRADKLQPYNPRTRVQTPGLSQFVEQAFTFTHAHSQENWTKPSVATLLSSLMPWEHTATQHESRVPRSVDMLPEVLKDNGFYTGAFIANGYVSDRFGFDQGWDTYRNYIREGRRTPAQFVAADVLSWLDERPQEQPFFLYVHTIDPHVPYRPPREFIELYDSERYSGPVSFRRDATLLENVKSGALRLAARDRQHLEALYDGEITYHDVHFAAIMTALERRGLRENTMIILTSDHGEEFWDHGSVGHGHSVFEELLHIPLFAALPGHQELTRIDTPVGLVDVMPTVLEALAISGPDEMSGRSFLAELQGSPPDAPAER